FPCSVTPATCPLSLHDALPISSPFVFSGLLFGLTVVVLLGLLRPDPLLLARRRGGGAAGSDPTGGPGMRAALAVVAARPAARLGDRKSTRLNSSHVQDSYAVLR